MSSYCRCCGVKQSLFNVGGRCPNLRRTNDGHQWFKRYEKESKGGGGSEQAQESEELNGCTEAFGKIVGGGLGILFMIGIVLAVLKAIFYWFLGILPALIHALIIGSSIAAGVAMIYFAFRSEWFREKALLLGKKIKNADYKRITKNLTSSSVTIPGKEKKVEPNKVPRKKPKVELENISNEDLISLIKKTHAEVNSGDLTKSNKFKVLMLERERRLKIKKSI